VLVGAVLAVAVLAVAPAVPAATPPPGLPSLAEVRAAGYEVTTLDGRRVPLAELLPAGRPVVVEFWATWCRPCRKTVPQLNAISSRHGGAVAVVGLTVEDPAADGEKVGRFVRDLGVAYPVAYAPREVYRLMNGRDDVAVPKLLVFDADGALVSYHRTYSPLTNRAVARAVGRVVPDGR
jgi:thiol-disulfide isomerase/thioredoxin